MTLEKKAFDVKVLDLKEKCDFTDFFIICSGNSRPQTQAISDIISAVTVDSKFEGGGSGVLDLYIDYVDTGLMPSGQAGTSGFTITDDVLGNNTIIPASPAAVPGAYGFSSDYSKRYDLTADGNWRYTNLQLVT